jgi:hypothetical protein
MAEACGDRPLYRRVWGVSLNLISLPNPEGLVNSGITSSSGYLAALAISLAVLLFFLFEVLLGLVAADPRNTSAYLLTRTLLAIAADLIQVPFLAFFRYYGLLVLGFFSPEHDLLSSRQGSDSARGVEDAEVLLVPQVR